jgi:hypothetical protein
MVGHEASRFPRTELLPVPVSFTTRGRLNARTNAPKRTAFRKPNCLGHLGFGSMAGL